MTTQLGCFGSVLYHSAESRRCNACPFLEACATKTAENKVTLDAWYAGLVAENKSARAARRKVSLGPAPVATPTRAPRTIAATTHKVVGDLVSTNGKVLTNVKAKEFVTRWTEKGIDFAAYKTGANPFATSGNKFASVAMQFFLDRGECTRLELTDHLIDHAGAKGPWGMGTSASHAGFVFEAFEYLGIITVSGNKAYLVR